MILYILKNIIKQTKNLKQMKTKQILKTETYERVIPRDFFNEAKLLKCFGQLSLKILDNKLPEGININISENGKRFLIELSDCGSLYIKNYSTEVNGILVRFKSTYNSKSNFPFYCEYNYCDYEVFNDNGEFTSEFIEFAKTL